MPIIERTLGVFGDVLLFSALCGAIVRRRVSVCFSFSLYILVVLISNLLIDINPDRFYEENFWLFKETLHAALKFAIAFELSVRIFRSYPGANLTARRVLLVIVFLTLCGVLAAALGEPDYRTLGNVLLPRILHGTAWLFTAIAVLILWYRVPVDSFAKAIVIGFVPYLLVFNIGLSLVGSLGWGMREASNLLSQVAYVTLLLYWNYYAWSHAPASWTLPSKSPA